MLTWWEGKATSGLGHGDARDHRLLVPRDRTVPGGRRPPGGPARVRDHAARDRARHELRAVAEADLSASAARRRTGRRRHRPGARASERTRALRVAQPRPRVDRGDACGLQGHPFDYFHVNSIDIDGRRQPAGLGAQHLGALQDRARASGEVIWRLGGKRSDFTMGPGTSSPGSTTRATTRAGGCSSRVRRRRGAAGRATVARAPDRLDTKRKRATLVRAVHAPSVACSRALHGQRAVLPNGNVVVGWGSEPYVTEYDAGGRDPSSMRSSRTAARTTVRSASTGPAIRRSTPCSSRRAERTGGRHT